MDIRSQGSGIESLVATARGAVLRPGDDRYEAACAGWNLAWTQRPAVLVRAATEEDVSHAVRFAAAQGFTVAVQNTGHGVAIPADGRTVLVSTRDLDRVRIDPEARTATVGGGSTWAPVLAAAQEHGLAPLLGSAPHVGAVGYSLGGGFGWLGRAHGLAVDAVRALRVVVADGRVVACSPTEEAELFWALCGTAGSALGVVVEMTVALAPVRTVHAGNLYYPLEVAAEAFDRYRRWTSRAPVELTSALNITTFPPVEMVPEPLRGNTFVIVRGCYAGADPDGAGARLIEPWRAWRAPLMDTWATMPFARCAEIAMDPVDPMPAASSGRWLQRLDDAVIEVMREAVVGGAGPSPMLFAEIRHAGGAVGRPNPAVCFAARESEWLLELVGLVPGPDAGADLEGRFAAAWDRLGPLLAGLPGFINFVEGAERVRLSRRTFDAAAAVRLAAIKRRHDPADLFRHGIPLADRA